jgi:biotin operon repressor
MNNVKGQFVCLPQMPKFDSVLKYTDTLIYVTIRSFNNEVDGCFPAYETIAARAGCCRLFVISAIKRLELTGLITVERSKKMKEVNRYTFTKEYRFEQIPYDLFDAELTLNEKSMLLCLRPLFTCGMLTSIYSIRKLAELLGLTYKVVHKNIYSLIKKGYMIQGKGNRKDVRRFTDKIDWPSCYEKQSDQSNALFKNYPPLKVA